MSDFIHLHEPGHPTLVLLHGTGGNERQMLEFGRGLSPSAGYLSIRGKELEGGRITRWFRRHAEGVFDEHNLIERAAELAGFLDGFERPRVGVGYSNGANMAAALLLLHPEAFDAAILFASMVPLSPPHAPALTGKPVLMIGGLQDQIVPADNARRLAEMLREAGAEVELRLHEGGHEIPPAEFEGAAEWLRSRSFP